MTEGDKRLTGSCSGPSDSMMSDFQKPIIGMASAWSEITPCNMHLNELAERAKREHPTGPSIGQTFGYITVSDGISMGHEGMKFSLVSREVVADPLRYFPTPSVTAWWPSEVVTKICPGPPWALVA